MLRTAVSDYLIETLGMQRPVAGHCGAALASKGACGATAFSVKEQHVAREIR